jgi:hypothetical protein
VVNVAVPVPVEVATVAVGGAKAVAICGSTSETKGRMVKSSTRSIIGAIAFFKISISVSPLLFNKSGVYLTGKSVYIEYRANNRGIKLNCQ